MTFARVSAQELHGGNSPIVSQCPAFYYLTFFSSTPNKLSHHFHLLLISQDEIIQELGWPPPHNTCKNGCYDNGSVYDLVICLEFTMDDELFSTAKCVDCMLNAEQYLAPSTTCTSLVEDGFCAEINSCEVCTRNCADEYNDLISCFLVKCGGCNGDECSAVFDRSSQASSVSWN